MADVGSDKDTERAVEGKVQQGKQHEEQEPEEGLCTKDTHCHLCRLTSEIKSDDRVLLLEQDPAGCQSLEKALSGDVQHGKANCAKLSLLQLSEPSNLLVLLQIKAAMRKGSKCAMLSKSKKDVHGIFERPAHRVWHK